MSDKVLTVDTAQALYNDLRSRLENTEEDINLLLAPKVDGARVDDGYLILTSAEYGDVTPPLGPFSGGGGSGGAGGGSGNNAVLSLSNLTGWITTTKPEGASCFLSILWSSLEDDEPNGPGTLTVRVNNVVKRVVNIPQGEHEEDVSSYLSLGINTIKLTIEDVYGNAKTLNFRVTVVTLGLKSTFDDSIPFSNEIAYTYTATGNVDKLMHFILDGEELVDDVIIKTNGRQSTQIIPKQRHGSHSLEVYFEAIINGETVYSNHLYYDLICYEPYNDTPIITSNFRDFNVTQYSIITIPYYVYTFGYITSTVQLFVNGEQEGSDLTVDKKQQIWAYKANTSGEVSLVIKSGRTEKHFTLNVEESGLDITPVTTDLALHLTAYGRSNNEDPSVRAIWNDGDIHCILEGFNWTSNGWIKKTEDRVPTEDDPSKTYTSTVLRVNGGASVTIPYQPFRTMSGDKDIKITGKTLEFEFATSTVDDYEKPIIFCFNGGIGFQITAQQAMFASRLSSVSSQYKEDEHVRVSFVISKRNEGTFYDSNGTRIIYIYVNGIISGAVQYPEENESFSQPVAQNITIGSDAATIDIYCIRVYDNDLSRRQMVANWIADMQDNSTMVATYKHNDIYGEDGISIDPSKLPQDLPYMIVKVPGDILPQSKTDKKTISGRFVDPADAEREKKNWRSFTFEGCEATTQGTSSQAYPIKNYKLKFSGGFKMAYQEEGETPKSKFAMNDRAVPTKTFVFKADFASSEGANNVELVRYYNDNCPAQTPPQKKSAEDNGGIAKIRVGIDGFPIVMFQEYEDGTIRFIGKYNFNNHKGTEEVYGLDGHGAEYKLDKNTKVASIVSEGIPDESWEMCDNNSELGRWKRGPRGANEVEIIEDLLGPWGEGELAAHTFEVRSPGDWYDAHTEGYHPELVKYQRFADLLSWVATTDTGNITRYSEELKKIIDTGIPVWADLERTEELNEHDPETGELIYHGPLLDTPVIYQTIEYKEDNKEYRLAKFRNEFARYFDKEASLYYYLFTEVFLMIDSRVKNSFPSYFAITKKVQDVDPGTGELVYDKEYKVDPETGDPIIDEETGEQAYDLIPRMHVEEECDETGWPKGRWTWLPYDMDTANGINNEGKLVFNYNLEDTDIIGGGNTVFNGQDSVLWNNIRMCFRADLNTTYRDIRNEGFSYETIEKNFETHQGAWPAMVFNDDAYYKYIQPLLLTGENRLEMCLGSKEQQRKWWLYNRFRYLDSKYLSLLAEQTINFRAYNPGRLVITPYADIYVRVKIGEAWTYAVRATRNTEVPIPGQILDPNDTESYIYSADQLKFVEGLGSFLPDTLDISKAIRLQKLDISADDATPNENLVTLTIDKNVQLKYLNMNNCVNFEQALTLINCINLEEAYFKNTKISSISFPDGGFLKKVHLPETITVVSFKNQTYIEELLIQGLDEGRAVITTLILENVSRYLQDRIIELLEHSADRAFVRLTQFSLEFETREEADVFVRILNKMRGKGDGDSEEEFAQVQGTLKINTPVNYTYIKAVQQGGIIEGERYPGYHQLEFDCQVSKTIEFWHEDGSEEYRDYCIEDTLDTEIVYGGPEPTKADAIISGRKYSYRFTGWGEEPNGIANPNILHNVNRSLKLYAAFVAIPYLNVRFFSWDGETQLGETQYVLKGESAVSVAPEVPLHPNTTRVVGWAENRFNEEDDIINNIQKDTDLFAILDWKVKSIRVDENHGPNKVNYYVGEVFDPAGMAIIADKDYLGEVVVKKYTYSNIPFTATSTEVVLTLGDKTTSVEIGIAESIEISQIPIRIVYLVNVDSFDPSGMKLTVYFSNGNTEEISYTSTGDITWDNHEIFDEIKPYSIIITYKGMVCVLSVISVDRISDILEENSWSVISAISSQGTASAYWSVGDEKQVPIIASALDVYGFDTSGGWHTGRGTFTFRILGFDHNKDIESPNTHTISFGLAHRIVNSEVYGDFTEEVCGIAVAQQKNSVWNEIWTNDSIIRRTCRAFETVLPAELKSVLKTTLKGQMGTDWTEAPPDVFIEDPETGGWIPVASVFTPANACNQQEDKVYIPSYYEIFGRVYRGSEYSMNYEIDESPVCAQFEYYRENSDRTARIKYGDAQMDHGPARAWWLRTFNAEVQSPPSLTVNRMYYFFMVDSAGVAGKTYGANNFGFVPVFTV